MRLLDLGIEINDVGKALIEKLDHRCAHVLDISSVSYT